MKASLSAWSYERAAFGVRLGDHPHLGLAALDLVGVDSVLLGKGRQVLAEIEHIFDLLPPIVEQREILGDRGLLFGNRGAFGHRRRISSKRDLRVTLLP